MKSGAAALYVDADVQTMDEDRPTAVALAVLDGRIIAVGGDGECEAALRSALETSGRSDYERISLGGKCLLPGFIDTHLHPIMVVYFDSNVDLTRSTDLPGVARMLSEAAASKEPGEWVTALQLEEKSLTEGRMPTRGELDAACPQHAVIVVKRDGHTCVGNSLALAAAGIDADTPNPAGGSIDRDPDGEPSGPCREAACQLLLSALPAPEIADFQQTARASFARLASQGITSVGAILQTGAEGPAGAAGQLEILAMSALLAEVPFSVYGILVADEAKAVLSARETPLHQPEAGHRVGGMKIFSDGTFGSCTACMLSPYHDHPEKTGYLVHSEEEIYRRMESGHRAGLQVCIHAIGDGANERCVALFERLLKEHPRKDHRHRLEHASLLSPELIERIARLELCVATQPLFIESEKEWLGQRLGEERAHHVYPLRDLVAAGVRVGGASDAPIESSDVLRAIQCCVTRDGFEAQQGISALEALRMFTIDAAFIQFEEAEKGTLAVGKRADLVVIEANPAAVAPERIADLKVLRTVVGGNCVYLAEET
jgi:predicted amidohydrolase YtcJ